MKMLCHLRPWSRSIDFLLVEDRLGTRSIAKQIIMETCAEPGMEVQPSFSLGLEDAQALMDALWVCGLRPSEGSGSAGAMAATQAHLKDLQKLLFEHREHGVLQ